MMLRRTWPLALVVVLAAVGTVSAQEAPRWGYVEGGYVDFDPDGGDSDNGVYGGVSFGILKMFHLVAEYDSVGDYSFWNAGGGWHGLLGEQADLFAEAVWEDVSVDTGSNDFDDNGYKLAGGVRWMLGDRFEVKGTVARLDFDEGGTDTTFEAEGLFFLLGNKLGVGASYETGDADTLRAFARWNFGR
ncbi:MAG TPA: hypothetical protein VFV75_00720 [Candidatus Polarisedimenticolaceae bacterium]|nr:hypothetical protein [Candidatus Polarisedimenticolaceae bacterium]